MSVALYMDVHVPGAITEQLRRRGVDVLTCSEDGRTTTTDAELLEHCHKIRRLIFTQDIRFKSLAQNWQKSTRPFAGLVFGHQLSGTIGHYVRDLELIATATDPVDWMSVVEHLPFL